MSHKQVIEKTRKALAGQTRGELLMRRTLLEAVIKTMQEKGDDQTWREVRTDDKLGVVEQYDLINEALHNLESPHAQVIGLERGIGHAKGLGPKE